ncbi:cellulase family glycosylhydrolase [Actomonas aquatica]|uniref:mannan endo-1,4-beta-mannosidase n=1 Tax=Actomonas aquatica TaxID=2866162 RepID=A0ABZ1C802_9BACT|nr:DUF5060 domain-containing protein [Opitutus sp. WL0086]WRQ87588.1 cellulase family glycosylhydrolase [Opitutus sp. WL0086]
MPASTSFNRPRPRALRAWIGALLLATLPTLAFTAPVELGFFVPSTDGNPFAREIWARVETPEEHVLDLPAYYDGGNRWAVRTRAAERGNYELLSASEFIDGVSTPLAIEAEGRGRVRVRDTDESGGYIGIDRRSGLRFVDGRGQLYTPWGGNLPWAASGQQPEDYYPAAFSDFRTVGFNWTRVWMCHWGRLNLDWVEPEHGEQPALGTLDLGVAQRLDQVINAAESAGLRLQLVLQHHGQYTTYNNSDWDENPWNGANEGGFLTDPTDFFTDAHARQLTRDKFRYIAARWGYSPSIMAWELFNEVMWTNARRGDAADNAAVAAWHDEMARHLRRYDVHGHLITTSDDDLHHAMWSAMDYYQPHLYASNMVLGLQALELSDREIDRPVFYGEMGDDNMAGLSSEQRATGFVHPILAWAGLFSRATAPAQMWYIETLRANDRWDEVASLSNFVTASGLLRHPLPHIEQPLVTGGDTTDMRLEPGHYWHRGPNPTIDVPADGTLPPRLIDFGRILTNAAQEHPFPSKVTLRYDAPAAATASLTVARVSNPGGALRITVDDETVVDQRFPAAATGRPAIADVSFPFRLGYGAHEIVIENPTGPDWIDLGDLNLGLPVPALTAVARRSPTRAVVWVHHRDNLLSPAADDELQPTAATVHVDDLPAGDWRISWWDPEAGRVSDEHTVRHPGGALALPTPAILRHAAAWLVRLPDEQ